jgi:hypothetical protein
MKMNPYKFKLLYFQWAWLCVDCGSEFSVRFGTTTPSENLIARSRLISLLSRMSVVDAE